jgi:thermitase
MGNLKRLTLPRAASGWLWAGILVLLLAACGTVEVPSDDVGPQRHVYIATVDISTADAPEAIAAAYGGDVVTWLPQAGFAVLGFHATPDGIRPLSTTETDLNQDVVGVPDEVIDDEEAEAAGVNAWAGGVNAWAGGVNAWAGGVNAWAGGVDNPFPGNAHAWAQIGLGQAQELATQLGQGVLVAVIDTGVDLNHSGFAGRLSPASTWLDLVDDDTYPHEGYEPVLRNGQWVLEPTGTGAYFGHGTAAAGIVLQAAPLATILPIRVLDSRGRGDASNIVKAIDHAVAQGAQVINLSLGTKNSVRAIQAMVDYAHGLGVIVVASSGNSGNTRVTYPAVTAAQSAYVHAIGVGSVDADDQRSSFSTYGTDLEMLAPGSGIATLFPGEATAYVNGTSFAAPWVSGVAALALGAGSVAPAQPIVDASTDIDAVNPAFAGLLGKGRLDAHAAIAQLLGH